MKKDVVCIEKKCIFCSFVCSVRGRHKAEICQLKNFISASDSDIKKKLWSNPRIVSIIDCLPLLTRNIIMLIECWIENLHPNTMQREHYSAWSATKIEKKTCQRKKRRLTPRVSWKWLLITASTKSSGFCWKILSIELISDAVIHLSRLVGVRDQMYFMRVCLFEQVYILRDILRTLS